jgi:2-oxoglutarate ferredoxin oxidoreductase subunit beta
MEGLAKMIEEAIRYPGFAFVNIQSPCITYGDADTQLKTQRARMHKLEAEGHDTSNRLRAIELAQEYGKTLYTGVFYRNPNPPPTYESQIKERQQNLLGKDMALEQLLRRKSDDDEELAAG